MSNLYSWQGYRDYCVERNTNEETIKPDYTIEEHNLEVKMFAPDGEFLGSTKNDLVFTDWRARINAAQASGYYIEVNDIKIPIDKRGTPKEWENGLFDIYTNALLTLI